MHMEEQNELMGEPFAIERALGELRALGGEPIRVRPRATGSSNETALRYVRQWPDIQTVD
eukprot:3522629-Heterocapsa_arctica.AAC.1